MIEINNLYKNLSNKEILKNINLKIEKGSIFGIIGPNGSGKTTLINTIVGAYKADSGSIEIMGEDIYENINMKEEIAFVEDENSIFSNYKVKDVISFYSRAYKNFNKERFNTLNNIFKIDEKYRISKLSRGMKKILFIMIGFSIMPKIIILDEPTIGLDPLIKNQFINLILEEVAERNTTILITSHNLDELERICDSIAIINKGEIKYTSSLDNMKENIKKLQVMFKEDTLLDLESWNEVIKVKRIGRVHSIVVRNYTKELEQRLNNCGATYIEEVSLGLEELFIDTMGGEGLDK
ncbi:ABC transporter family protein [Clostridium argentinense CDC 2741]|uniref:ABC transporter family protein n=1 Tax=Clostridium argentinense CDC 2741 TaxID=1418104 RepID=A0A0C1TZS6_9CLOT|nr:ABC transporter ATP-binding protein [Clostridium argentinense]ARC84010.1 ABC transporter [Clostridium argentinense]KIE44788.1 ABC transporter family protein [Clostridium argentinense CDC 2741]NFF39384.1 ABC transporter ATP-binding protein [Clostridium argentinense]NFP50411.1 ABC transporter ATP-binding protein [Clostridium argentinense]NFP73365.1 ABC transporter ATP-binding protein [Clostridium argentinense]